MIAINSSHSSEVSASTTSENTAAEAFTATLSPVVDYSTVTGEAIVDTLIEPSQPGRVKFQGSWWSARCDRNLTIPPGEVVQVIGRENITLLVEPAFAETP